MLLHNQGIDVEIGTGDHAQRDSGNSGKYSGSPNETMIKPAYTSHHEAGKIYHGMQRTFLVCGQILPIFYFSYQTVSDSGIHRIIRDNLREAEDSRKRQSITWEDSWKR